MADIDDNQERPGDEHPTEDLNLPWEPERPPSPWDEPPPPPPSFSEGVPPPPSPAVLETTSFSSGPARRPGRTVVALVVAGLLFMSAGIGIGWTLNRFVKGSSSASPSASASAGTQQTGGSNSGSNSSGPALNVQGVATRVNPAVVDINTSFDSSKFGGGGNSTEPSSQAAGTGMILTSSGEVLTNNHVVQGANNISVTIQGRSGHYAATVVGVDPVDDVALIQIQGVSGLPTVALADSSQVSVGEKVVAIGNALGRGGTPSVTQGTVSALNQAITVRDGLISERLNGLIQFDAPISPGDSGGPLVNMSGRVVGMITAAESAGRSQRVSYQGYAIAVNTASHIVDLIRSGQSNGNIIIGPAGFLGVEVSDLDPATAARLGLNVSSGVLVLAVIPGTPAETAGISRYAVITAIDGRVIQSADELGPALHTHRPGDRIQVTFVDQSGTHTVTVRLIAGPAA